MVYGEPIDTILNLFSSTFMLPMQWFGFPQVIFLVILPVIGLISLWITFLMKFLRVFHNSNINIGIGIIIGLISTPLIRIFTPTYVLAIAVSGSLIFYGDFKLWKIIASLILLYIMITFYPVLMSRFGLVY